MLKGITHEKDGKMYLQVNEIQQAGTTGFKDVRGDGKWMPADGGSSEFPTNKAGAAYGTGYCDAQCPHDLKFIDGEANTKN